MVPDMSGLCVIFELRLQEQVHQVMVMYINGDAIIQPLQLLLRVHSTGKLYRMIIVGDELLQLFMLEHTNLFH